MAKAMQDGIPVTSTQGSGTLDVTEPRQDGKPERKKQKKVRNGRINRRKIHE